MVLLYYSYLVSLFLCTFTVCILFIDLKDVIIYFTVSYHLMCSVSVLSLLFTNVCRKVGRSKFL